MQAAQYKMGRIDFEFAVVDPAIGRALDDGLPIASGAILYANGSFWGLASWGRADDGYQREKQITPERAEEIVRTIREQPHRYRIAFDDWVSAENTRMEWESTYAAFCLGGKTGRRESLDRRGHLYND
jgi:hypothetical protein